MLFGFSLQLFVICKHLTIQDLNIFIKTDIHILQSPLTKATLSFT